MDEEFAHGGDNGALVGFSAGEKTGDIGRDDGIARGSSVSSHVETFADFGATAKDGAFGARLTAIAIERGDAGEGDNLVALEGFHFGKIAKKSPGGDFADALNRLDDVESSFELRVCADQLVDGFFNGRDLRFQNAYHALDGSQDGGFAVLEAVLLASKLIDEVSTPIEERRELKDDLWHRRHGLERFAPGEGQDHPAVDGIGFGLHSLAAGKIANPGRIDHGQWDFGLVQSSHQIALIATGGFENDQRMRKSLQITQELAVPFSGVFQGKGTMCVLELEGGFGNVDGDIVEGIVFSGSFHGFSRSCEGELATLDLQQLDQLFEIKPRCRGRSVLRDEIGFAESGDDMIFPTATPGLWPETRGVLAPSNLGEEKKIFRKNLGPSALKERQP